MASLGNDGAPWAQSALTNGGMLLVAIIVFGVVAFLVVGLIAGFLGNLRRAWRAASVVGGTAGVIALLVGAAGWGNEAGVLAGMAVFAVAFVTMVFNY